MTDFGRKDFGDALKKLFEAKKDPLVDPLADEIGKFGTQDAGARAASKLGKDDLGKIDTDAQESMKKFANLWTPFTKTLKKETQQVVRAMELFASTNTSVADENPTTDDQASTDVFGGTKSDLAKRFAAADAAGETRKLHGGNKIQDLSRGDFGSGAKIAPGDMQGKDNPEQIEKARLASMSGAGDRRLQSRLAKQKRRMPAAGTTGEGTLSDFSNMLSEMVEMFSEAEKPSFGTSGLHQSPEERAAGGPMAMPTLKRGEAAPTGRELVQKLRAFALEIDKQVAVLDGTLKEAMTAFGKNFTKMSKTFGGLSNLTSEQQEHIATITTQANDRLKKLKADLKPLAKMKDDLGDSNVADLLANVTKLEADLARKQSEMDTQEQEYEYLLDYYEDIMIDMKKAEMEAKRELRNMEAELAVGMTSRDFAHYEPKGSALEELTKELRRPIVEAVEPVKKKKKKKKSAEFNYYGTFNFNEHLEKAREQHPKANGDW